MTAEPESLTSELDDLDEAPLYDWGRIDPSLLREPVVIRAFVGVALALAIVLWPERTDLVLSRVIAVGAIVLALQSLWGSLRTRSFSLTILVSAAIGIAFGLVLLAAGERSVVVLGRLMGALVVAVGVRDLWAYGPGQASEEGYWPIARATALIASAALVIAFPTELFSAVTIFFGLSWAALGLIALRVSLDPRTDDLASYRDTTDLVSTWLRDRPKDTADRRELYAKILYEGPTASLRVVRFATLMTFASIISSMGVITDSTAVVIGAMLIAPLMTPLMGMAISIVMGWPHRLIRSALVALGGIAIAIVTGLLLGLILPAVIDTATNSQITSRTLPTTLDLVTAVAAGAAGAYGLSRPDVSDSLPGVAIAISLVPPLTVVGIAYSQGDWQSGSGALLLFATNALAILVVGGLTFVVTGVTPVERLSENQHRIRTWGASLATVGAAVVGLLILNGTEVIGNTVEQGDAAAAVSDWLDTFPNHDTFEVIVDGDVVEIVLVGPRAGAPSAGELAELLAESLGRPVTADIRLVVEERDVASSGG